MLFSTLILTLLMLWLVYLLPSIHKIVVIFRGQLRSCYFSRNLGVHPLGHECVCTRLCTAGGRESASVSAARAWGSWAKWRVPWENTKLYGVLTAKASCAQSYGLGSPHQAAWVFPALTFHTGGSWGDFPGRSRRRTAGPGIVSQNLEGESISPFRSSAIESVWRLCYLS